MHTKNGWNGQGEKMGYDTNQTKLSIDWVQEPNKVFHRLNLITKLRLYQANRNNQQKTLTSKSQEPNTNF